MKYKLYESEIKSSDIVTQVLANRGINNAYEYLHLTDDILIDYNKLDKINDAVEMFKNHYEAHDPIAIVIDEDVDGNTSGASMYSYIKRLDENYPVSYILHGKAKAHGLGKDVIVPEDTKFLIIPDAGTNDVDKCKEYNLKGIDVLILDHHELEEENEFAVWQNYKGYDGVKTVIVNNQTSPEYSNKDLCGVGIVYKFLQALDDELWVTYADEFLDLVAFGNISDVMDMRSYETRRLVDKGLANIKNKFMQALIVAQDYSMNGVVNIHNVQWYMTPICNAQIRIGTSEDKELMFRAFIEKDEFFEYKKRATKNKPAETIQESIYDRAARLCKNAKSRQDKMRDKGVAEISKIVKDMPEDQKVILVDVTDILDNRGLTGVLAIRIAEMFNKPCILVKEFIDDNNELIYGGSARNMDHSPVESFKDVVNGLGDFIQGVGHQGACGIFLKQGNFETATKAFNEALKDVEYDATYLVDYIYDADEVDVTMPIEMDKFKNIIGQGIDEPTVAIENVRLYRDDISIFGKSSNTLAFNLDNGVRCIQFFCKEGHPLYDFANDPWDDGTMIICNVVGKPGINDYQGTRTPQITIEDVEIIESIAGSEAESDFDDEDIW